MKKKARITGYKTKQSVSEVGGGENTYLLQQEEENVYEETNDDADVNTEANKVNDNKKDLVVKMKEHNKTLKKNVDIEKITRKNNHFREQYLKLLKTHILKKQNFPQQNFKTNVEIIQMNLRTHQMKSKQILKMSME